MRKEERDQPVANLELRIDLEQVTSKLWRKSQWTYIPCSPSLYPSPSPSLPPLVEDGSDLVAGLGYLGHDYYFFESIVHTIVQLIHTGALLSSNQQQ